MLSGDLGDVDRDVLKGLAEGSDTFEFRGWVMGSEYSEAIHEADICFWYERYGNKRYSFSSNKLSDYLCYGKPVLMHCNWEQRI